VEDLIRTYAPAVRTYWRRRLKGTDAVDEATQEVFLRFVQALRSGTSVDPARAGGFLLGICKNVARERARQNERRSELWEQFGSELAPLQQEPRVEAYQLALLEDCMSQMTLRSRDVIKGSFIEGASAAEIGAKLTMTENNVRVVRHRAIESLRECMTQKIFWDTGAAS
jgi:RNA polymerase sigma-70 factor (ECF subfamily)